MDLHDYAILYDIWEYLGAKEGKRVILYPLPGHHHANFTPSFSIIENRDDGHQRWKCHGNCGKSGDVIDLAGYMHIPGYDPHNKDHLAHAINLLESKADIRPPKIRRPKQRLNNGVLESLQEFDREIALYMSNRGISEATLRHFNVRKKWTAAAIPTFENNRLKMIKYRNTGGSGPRYWSEKGSSAGLFNHDEVHGSVRPVLIVKSELAAMFMWQRATNYKVCAPSGGENAAISEYFEIMAYAPKRVYVGDNDRDPATRRKMQEFARRRSVELQADLRFPPCEYKDIDEWLLDRPKDIREVEKWMKAAGREFHEN
jgi:hypothetical protein